MFLTQTGLELMERLERPKDVPALVSAFQNLVLAFGMKDFCIGDPSIKAKRNLRRWDNSWQDSWCTRYARQEYFFHDPLVARINVVTATFRWSATDELCGGGWYNLLACADPKGAQLAHESREFGRKVGLAVPIHGRHGVTAAVSIATDHYDLSPRDERALQMVSLYLHARLKELRTEASPRPVHNLTPRERDCLQWVAAGKTDWEISQILSISEQTVHGYVQNALTKLNARTRAQAVALAMQTAQILP